jgi:hypothetical protein
VLCRVSMVVSRDGCVELCRGVLCCVVLVVLWCCVQ